MTRTDRILSSWFQTRRAMRQDARALAARRERLWSALQPSLLRTPALKHFAGQPLSQFPITHLAQMREDLGLWNSLGLSDASLRAAAERTEADGVSGISGLAVGYSTGSSGSRGVFVADEGERARYIGQSIAKLLPLAAIATGARIALFLRANSALYSDVTRGRFRFAHFPLAGTPHANREALERFAPDVLIAPSHILAGLARLGRPYVRLKRCFFGAEPMGDREREFIAASLGVRPDPIYQATEGFLGAACRLGRLHLNEDSIAFELLRVAGTHGFQLVVTDLRRTSQPIVRVLLDDFVELYTKGCDCGFAGRAILPLAGRVSDLWRFDPIITPREVTRGIEEVLGPGVNWVAHASPRKVRIDVEAHADGVDTHKAAAAIAHGLSLSAPVDIACVDALNAFPKRRRVRWSATDG